MKVWDLRLSVCKLLSISHMNECLWRLIVPVFARGTATKNSMSSVIILCVDILLLLLEPLQSLQRWALICDIITRDTNERVQQSTQQGSYKLSLSGRHLWFQDPALIINPLVFLSLRCFEKNLFRLSFSRSHDDGPSARPSPSYASSSSSSQQAGDGDLGGGVWDGVWWGTNNMSSLSLNIFI